MSQKAKKILSVLMLSVFMFQAQIATSVAYGAIISTSEAVAMEHQSYDKSRLKEAIQNTVVQEKLATLGVSAEEVEHRIDVLTPQEVAALNQHIETMPAGQGVVSVLLTLFIVFVVTDMLCATDVFTFVNCINK